MQMTLRWYGTKFNTVTLEQIRQIPGVTGVITTLYDTQPGETWSRERIHAMKEEVAAAGLQVVGIESVNVHEDIKAGTGSREQYMMSAFLLSRVSALARMQQNIDLPLPGLPQTVITFPIICLLSVSAVLGVCETPKPA